MIYVTTLMVIDSLDDLLRALPDYTYDGFEIQCTNGINIKIDADGHFRSAYGHNMICNTTDMCICITKDKSMVAMDRTIIDDIPCNKISTFNTINQYMFIVDVTCSDQYNTCFRSAVGANYDRSDWSISTYDFKMLFGSDPYPDVFTTNIASGVDVGVMSAPNWFIDSIKIKSFSLLFTPNPCYAEKKVALMKSKKYTPVREMKSIQNCNNHYWAIYNIFYGDINEGRVVWSCNDGKVFIRVKNSTCLLPIEYDMPYDMTARVEAVDTVDEIPPGRCIHRAYMKKVLPGERIVKETMANGFFDDVEVTITESVSE